MIALDMKTVMFGNVIINAVCLIVLLILWYQNRNKYSGLFYWVIDWVLQAWGALLIALRGIVPNWASMVLSNSMIVGGTLILYFGLCRFAGKKNASILKYLVLIIFAMFISIQSYFVYVHNDLMVRSYNISIGLSLACLMSMWLMFKGMSPEIHHISKGTGISFAMIILISLIRIIGFSFLPNASNDYLKSGMFDTLLVLLLLGAIVFLVFNLVLMVNRRLYIESKQAMEKLLQSHQLLDETGRMAKVGGWELDLSTKEISWTEEVGRIHAVEPGYKLKLKEALDFYAPEYRPNVEVAVKRSAETGEPYDLESLFIPRGSKDKIWVRLIGKAIYSGGKIVKLAGTFQDINKYKRAEETLKLAEQNLRNSMDNSPLGIRIHIRDGESLYVNKAFLDTYSYDSIDEFNATPLSERTTPESYAAIRERQEKEKQGQPVLESFEEAIVRKDGGIRHLRVWRRKVIWSGQSRDLRLSEDITEQRKAEKALRESEEWFKEALTLGRIGSWEFDVEKQTITWSEITYVLYERDMKLGPPSPEEEARYYSPEQAKVLRDHAARAIETGQTVSYDLELILPSGKTAHFSSVMRPVKDAQGRVIKLSGTVQDISERKQAEAMLQQLYKQERELRESLELEIKKRTEFTRALVHELKTPLTPVLASSELLVSELKQEPWQSLAGNVFRGALKLNERIDELLDLARGEIGILRLRLAILDPMPLLHQVVQSFSAVMSLQGKNFSLDLPSSLAPILADEDRLRQILLNLLNNAVKFTSKGGYITLRAREKETFLIVEIEDTGLGIAKDDQAKLFTPYYRTESNRQRFSGLGLGLSLSKVLVELQGGRIWLESEEGKGSTFGFSVPLATADQIENDRRVE